MTSPSVLIACILPANISGLFLSSGPAMPSVGHVFLLPFSGAFCHSEHILPSKSRHLTMLVLLDGSFRYCCYSSRDSVAEPFKCPRPADSQHQSFFCGLASLFYFLFPSGCFSKSSVSSTPCSYSPSFYHGLSQTVQSLARVTEHPCGNQES